MVIEVNGPVGFGLAGKCPCQGLEPGRPEVVGSTLNACFSVIYVCSLFCMGTVLHVGELIDFQMSKL